ncbi:MAG: hypothetical protein ACJ70X_02975 [Nitrososphaera sp.]
MIFPVEEMTAEVSFEIKSFGNCLGGRTLNKYDDDSTSSELISRLSGSSRAAKELSSSFGGS